MAEMTAEEREDIRRGVQEGELIVEFGAPDGASWLEVEARRMDVATKAWWRVKVKWLKRGCVQRQSLPEEGIEAHLVKLFETLLADLIWEGALTEEEAHRRRGRLERPAHIVLTQPVGNCDGSGKYAYDSDDEDGRGAKLTQPCPGCRACR